MIPQKIKDIDIGIYNKLEPIWDTLSQEAQDLILSLLGLQTEYEEMLIEKALDNYPDFESKLVNKIKIEKGKVFREMEKEDKQIEVINFTGDII